MSDFLRKFTIPFVVFITGACVLVIEIVAIRILAPFFGNTIFTFSSVISVVLAALSLGYYFGGRLADKYPEEKLFYSIIALSGFSVIILHFFGYVFLSSFGYRLSIAEGPLVASVLMFFFQSFLLGLLSPFAVKLQKMRVEELGVGSAAGQIFFWSTLGSIFGSLAAGFFLIPNFGIDKIVLGVGFLLLALGLLSVVSLGLIKKVFGVGVLMILFFLTSFLFNPLNQGLVLATDSLYQKIIIFDGEYEGKPTRFLQQDRNSSAAMFFDSDELAYEYTKYYILYQLFSGSEDIKEVLAIGGGAYSVPKDILEGLPKVNVDVAEIDPLIFELAKKYFKVPENEPRLTNFAEDGRRLLHDSSKKYDLIFSDAYSSFFSTPEHLTTKEFFELAKEKMSDNGVFIANVVGSLENKPKSFMFSEIRTFISVFKNSYFFAVESPNFSGPQNIIFVGLKNNQSLDLNSPKIKNGENHIIRDLPQKQLNISNLNLSQYPALTDNFAPVDYLISKEFTNL